jgi:hypothetical protein
MGITNWLLSGVARELILINQKLIQMEGIMDQERAALDALVTALNAHFTTVETAVAKILELLAAQVEPDVDNSAEIAAIAGQIQASTDAIKAVLP